MNVKSLIRLALKNISNNKLRSFLTMLGLIIGITSVIVLVGIVNGSSSTISSEVQSLGADILTVSISNDDYIIDYSQFNQLKNFNNIRALAPYKNISSSISYDGSSTSRASIIATTEDYTDVLSLTISSGRLLSEIDLENNSKVCILGNEIAEDLLGSSDNAVGKSVKIDGDNYKVVGVLTAVGSSLGSNIDDIVIMPLTTAKYLGSDTMVSDAYVSVANQNIISSTATSIEQYLKTTLGATDDDLSVSSQDSMLDTMDNIDNTMSILMGGIASISLIVGGIGVMNVMLVSVTERTKEIGIRKALGAKRRDILMQFLTESLLLCLIGGLIGVLLGLGLGSLLGKIGFTFEPGIGIILIAFLSSLFIGVTFGIYPADKASKLKPIEALHAE